jgi:hypothetical protein
MDKIYSRDFIKNSIRLKNKLRISKFFPEKLAELIEFYVPEGNHILGVTYSSGDSQICISGHPKVDENLYEGTRRELKEELCLSTNLNLEFCHKENNNYYCFLNIKDTYLTDNRELNNNRDIKPRSIICVYGEEKDILHYLSKINYNLQNSDKIISLWSTTKRNILNYHTNNDKYISNC